MRHGERTGGKWGEKDNPRGTERRMLREREKNHLKKKLLKN